MIHSVLMVCTGNICRSPLAEAQLANLVPALTVTSAGVGALVDHPADANALAVAEANGLDLSRHRARQIDATHIRDHELILTMEQGHSDWVMQRFPQSRGRVHLLGRWQGNEAVADPYRRSPEFFGQIFTQIQRLCADWSQRLAA